MKLRESAKGGLRGGELSEDLLVAQLLPPLRLRTQGVVLGPGDDCAVVRCAPRNNLLLLKTDCVVEAIHFTAATPPYLVGLKAMARPLSDFAAMSGTPQFALITLVISAARRLAWAKELYRGLTRMARKFRVVIVGGETSRTKGPIVVSVSVVGFVEQSRWVGRNGGKAGDELFVTGRLGGSIRGKHLRFIPRIEEARWLTENFPIHAMMDLSDGLGTDLPRLSRASGVGFEVDDHAIPRNRGCTLRQALADGEDYELLFAISPDDGARLMKRWKQKFPRLLLTRVGRLTSKVETGNSNLPSGYVHFK